MSNHVDLSPSRLQRHWDDAAWDDAAVRDAQKKHVNATWGPGNSLDSVPIITDAEGIYIHTSDGRKLIDWTSQAVCVNMGHTVPPSVIEAVVKQLETVPMIYAGVGMTEQRARLSALISDILPDPLTGLLFPSSGAEANEAAIRIARRFTGKSKILTQYRSYHGGTSTTLGATGDVRRGFAESNVTGMVHMVNPTPWKFSWGDDPEAAAERALAALDEQICLEGPDTIAGVLIESVVGSGGVLVPHPTYMRGVRALCDTYGILYIADEVMAGFGRTGKMWAFQHFDGVVPDLVTSAKGLSSAWMPISMVAMRSDIHEWARDTPVGWGSTFQAHPVAVACAYACVKHMLETDLVGHAASLEPTIAKWQDKLVEKHPSVRQGRAIGCFGCLDLVTPGGQLYQPLTRGPLNPAFGEFKKALMDEGIYGFVRPGVFHTAPPLVVTHEQLDDGFARVDRALDVLDAALGH